jgi:hypothetical protein
VDALKTFDLSFSPLGSTSLSSWTLLQVAVDTSWYSQFDSGDFGDSGV